MSRSGRRSRLSSPTGSTRRYSRVDSLTGGDAKAICSSDTDRTDDAKETQHARPAHPRRALIDGSGTPGFYGAVAVEDERVRILRGDTAGIEARRVIDATGRVVCPGFIDMHAHSGLVILAEPQHEPKVRQGITTELIGIDGNSYAPFHSHEDFLK